MEEPNFSEGQLQQLTNTEIFNLVSAPSSHGRSSATRYASGDVFASRGAGPPPMGIPILITPWLESLLGWDTAFWFPWLGVPHTDPDQMGCNFFIQYKLSDRHESRYAKGWKHWQQPFLRFHLGYRRRQRWDYSQRNALERLSSSGFRVVYVTNHVLDSTDLFNLATADRLCTELPVLRVVPGLTRHGYVTFVPTGANFILHSKKEPVEVTHLKPLINSLEPSTLTEDFPKLVKVIKSFEEEAGIRENGYTAALQRLPEVRAEDKGVQAMLLGIFLRRYFDVFWWRFKR